jgi:gamma-glutamylcyclotransferase
VTAHYYLAYGSNLHPMRLARRVPSARLVGPVPLPGYRLAFHKRGMDGSAKCDLELTDESGAMAYGAVFSVAAKEIDRLDQLEDFGDGYFKERVTLRVDGTAVSAFIYFASHTHIEPALRPFDWYKGLVLAGARHHDFPQSYVDQIEAVPHRPDPDGLRRAEMAALLAKL